MRLITNQSGNNQENRYAHQTERGLDVAVCIYFDSEFQEYQVHSWNPNGEHALKSLRSNVYHTDDKQDAFLTADFILKRGI